MTFIIAEVGPNHNGSIDRALSMIPKLARAGADAIKFQTYRASSLASVNSPAYWDQQKEPTKTQFDYFNQELFNLSCSRPLKALLIQSLILQAGKQRRMTHL